jgi:hypothetical protein
MHLVDDDLQVERAPGRRVHILRGMAKHAHIHAAAPSAVPRQLIVTGVAARRPDDVVDLGHFRAIGDEVELSARVLCGQWHCSQVRWEGTRRLVSVAD